MPTALTKRSCTPLLRTVRGKPHATDSDHEESKSEREARAKRKQQHGIEEQDVNAEPVSSDDELTVSAPQQTQSLRHEIPVSVTEEDMELQEKPVRARQKTQSPSGALEKGRTLKANKGVKKGDESASSTHSSSTKLKDDEWPFDDLHRPVLKKARSQKTQYGTKVRPSFSRSNFYPLSGGESGLNTSRETSRTREDDLGRSKRSVVATEEDDLSDVSMTDVEGSMQEPSIVSKAGDLELHIKKPENIASHLERRTGITRTDDTELNRLLDERSRVPRLLDQLNSWVEDHAPAKSHITSSIPDSLHIINQYIDQLPQAGDEDRQCMLCKEIVSSEDCWEFWKSKDKTIKNQTAFCNMHSKKAAQAEYDREGYPEIDWSRLPARIRKCRTELVEILKNSRSSKRRDLYTPLALTGKATAVPSMRKDLPQSVQEKLDSYALEDQSTYPGYYGPRGRRLITEAIMELLKNEVQNCDDPVIQVSGPAAFIQAVIVPEAAVLLIMEDCRVDRQAAEAIREKTYDMGFLLNEEIEDQLEAQHSDESENEYQVH